MAIKIRLIDVDEMTEVVEYEFQDFTLTPAEAAAWFSRFYPAQGILAAQPITVPGAGSRQGEAVELVDMAWNITHKPVAVSQERLVGLVICECFDELDAGYIAQMPADQQIHWRHMLDEQAADAAIARG